MFQLNISSNLYHFFLTHMVSIIIFAIIYYILFNNIDKHYILNSNISKEDYQQNKLINSLFLSVNMQTSTAYVDFNVKSSIARLTTMCQLFLSLLISGGFVFITIKDYMAK